MHLSNVGDHSFHEPIQKENLTEYSNLEVIRIEPLITKGASGGKLLSTEFADKVREALLTNKAIIKLNTKK